MSSQLSVAFPISYLASSDTGQNPRMDKAEKLPRALSVIAYTQLFSCKVRWNLAFIVLNSVRPLWAGQAQLQ